ncbi:MAG TPA: GMC family oxidoreductase [Actinomycetota bacterium]|nr:GMC family oxidoreductase [Actinomycetota bacterium]
MIFPRGAARRTDHDAAADVVYDVVIVGAGISGAIIANELGAAGKRVLMLEAGPGDDITLAGYKSYLERFYGQAIKHNQSPFPDNPNAPMPKSIDARRVAAGAVDSSAYLVQEGPFSTDTTYTRVFGGTTMHWEGKTLRMLPEDFETRTRYGQGRDWPIGYEDLAGYYNRAELELATSADVEDQAFLGIHFDDGYVYPMKGLPLSYLDQQVDAGIRGTTVELGGGAYELKVRPFPQARNGIPNPDYDGGKGYVPVGAVSTHQVEEGHRCQGNINCVPLCPVQAKYNAGKTLAVAFSTGRVDLLAQTVASKVVVDSVSGQVTGIEYKSYADPNSPEHVTGTVRGKVFVLAANAIENARLMLASGLPSTSGLVGRNLMDHAYLLTWALMPQVCGTGRGSVCTGGIQELRGGGFRRDQAAFNCDIHNEGWAWATGSPYPDLAEFVDEKRRFGKALRTELVAKLTRQLLLAFMVEVMPEESNTVSVDPSHRDPLGNMRPFISFQVPEYSMNGVAFARRFARDVFARLGAEDHTAYDADDYGYVTHDGEGYAIRGGNHLGGTHIMGANARDSVVDSYQRSWDHDNLYLAGGGSMPTIGSSNVTLTLAALCFRTSEKILERLRDDARPVEVRGA